MVKNVQMFILIVQPSLIKDRILELGFIMITIFILGITYTQQQVRLRHFFFHLSIYYFIVLLFCYNLRCFIFNHFRFFICVFILIYSLILISILTVASKFDQHWGRKFHERVLLLVRDIANPSASDPYFPTWRHKDW